MASLPASGRAPRPSSRPSAACTSEAMAEVEGIDVQFSDVSVTVDVWDLPLVVRSLKSGKPKNRHHFYFKVLLLHRCRVFQ